MITMEVTNFSSSSNMIVVAIFRYLCSTEPPYNKVLCIINNLVKSNLLVKNIEIKKILAS